VTTRQPDPAPGAEPERGFVLAAPAKGADAKGELAELRELARTAGVEPIDELVQHRERPDPRTYVGKGKLVELQDAFKRSSAESLIVDDELTPVQQRRLEDALQARVVDRTQLILDIFAQHAVSAEGKLQVELAQLEYNLPRMRGLWQHLERLGGGLGTRGPGESQLETDRRLPHQLVEGFAATLEETLVADLVLHVVDASTTDEELDAQLAAVQAVLAEIGAGELPVELVLNKIDAIDSLRRRRVGNRFPEALQVSARTGEGLEALRERIAARFGERFEAVRLLIPYDEGGRLAELYALGMPVDERADREEGVFIRAHLPMREVRRFAQYLIVEPDTEARSSA
jgi:50S ribosomal subunit-associated GTPase HflX